MKDAIYVCHTYYHVYVSILKEFARPKEEQGKATLVLSKMSTDFETLKERAQASGVFSEVYEYDEQLPNKLPDYEKYKTPSKNFIKAIMNRAVFSRKVAKMQEPYIPVNFRDYKEIYVYCDSDPIGYYLNMNHIYYHAMEDGHNSIANWNHARYDNANHFEIKVFCSKRLNLFPIQNGYGKYCYDVEINDQSIMKYPCPYYKEVSRKELYNRLTREEKDILLKIFVKDEEKLKETLYKSDIKTVLFLTEPLCEDLTIRKQIFCDLIERFKDYVPIIKVHPRDELDYVTEFPDVTIIDRTIPMEMLNFYDGAQFDLVVAVFTPLEAIHFAKEKLSLGRSFMDAYEDPERHKAKFSSTD